MMVHLGPNRLDPDYRDPSEGLDDASMEDLLTWLCQAEDCATDPDVPARTRARCDDAIQVLAAEIEARRRDEIHEYINQELDFDPEDDQ